MTVEDRSPPLVKEWSQKWYQLPFLDSIAVDSRITRAAR
jgi:hypothetical protein